MVDKNRMVPGEKLRGADKVRRIPVKVIPTTSMCCENPTGFESVFGPIQRSRGSRISSDGESWRQSAKKLVAPTYPSVFHTEQRRL